MQVLRTKVCIASQHLPVLMTGDEGDLWNFEAGFEQAACPFMPQIMKVKVFDTQGLTCTVEGSPYGPAVIRKNAN